MEKERAKVLLPDMVVQNDNEPTTPIVEYRRLFLDGRKHYVENVLIAEYDIREAELKKKLNNAGYFALGTKGVGISAGIASAILVTASPANAAIVAGLGALTSGTVAFQDTASSVGYSTAIVQAQIEALKTAVNTAYCNNNDVPWEYLYSYAGCAKQAEWNAKMLKLGQKIESIETAIRFTKYEIKITATDK
jgi:hypothetical protein